MKRLKKLDLYGMVALLPLSRPELPNGYPLPPVEQMRDELHLIDPDGHIYKGADAVFRLAKILPRTRTYGKILSLPVIGVLARPVYRLVARNRMKLSAIMRR